MTPTSGGPSAPPASDSLADGGHVSASDAPTGTIPVYSPQFPDPNFGPNHAPNHLANDPSGQPVGAHAAAGPVGPGAPGQPMGAPGQPAGGPGARRGGPRRGPRRAQLQLRHINPWTVLKFTCVLSIALFFVWLIVVGVLYGVLDAAGVIDKINHAVTTINGDGSSPPVTAGVVFGGAAIIGVINMILFIALSTVGSVVYNLCADLVGGIEITLSES